MVSRFGGDDQLADADAHVRSGGEGLKSTHSLTHSHTQSVSQSVSNHLGSKSWTTVRCGAVHPQSKALELSQSKQGTWACQNEGLGDLRDRGGETLGYLRSVWSIARPGRAASGPGHCAHYATLFPWIWTQDCQSSMRCKCLSRCEAREMDGQKLRPGHRYFIAGSKR